MRQSRKIVMLFVAALMVAGVAVEAYGYSDVVTAMQTLCPTELPTRLRLTFDQAVHQDRFLASRADGLPLVVPGFGGYVTLEQPSVLNPIIAYGLGNVLNMDIKRKGFPTEDPIIVDTSVKVAFGNAAAVSETVLYGTAANVGTGTAIDCLTGAPIPGAVATQYTDGGGGLVIVRTDYNFNVAAGTDYNRDGTVADNSPLTSAAASTSDRPFIVLYESLNGLAGQPARPVGTNPATVDLRNPPVFDAEAHYLGAGDGITVDNAWVGNPYSPVDVVGDGNAAVDCDPNLVLDDSGDPLLVAELKSFWVQTTFNLSGGTSNLSIHSMGGVDFEVTDGRLYDWMAAKLPSPPSWIISGTFNGSAFFTPGGPILTEYEFDDDGTMNIYPPTIPEPATGLLVLGSLAGLVVRRRRK